MFRFERIRCSIQLGRYGTASNGIDASRLVGPNGYGESRPLENLGDAFPGCKSETNRRTELNTQ